MTAFMLAILMVAAFGLTFVPGGVNAKPEDPWLEVKPSYYMTSIMEEFNVSVLLNGVTAEKKLSSLEFRLLYNGTLLEVVNVIEGPFLPSFPNRPNPPYTIFTWVNDSKVDVYGPNLLIANALIPNGTANPPVGNGEIAKITLRGIYPKGSCALKLDEIMLLNDKLEIIPFADPKSGYYDIWPLLCDVNRDKRVDILDVVLVAKAFGSFPGDPRWNPRYDTNRDEKIDILDLAIFRVYFGKWIS